MTVKIPLTPEEETKLQAQAKVEGLRNILLEQLKSSDVFVRTTCATLLGELGDSSDPVIAALYEAYKTARADKINVTTASCTKPMIIAMAEPSE